jgi:hypothetical protein
MKRGTHGSGGRVVGIATWSAIPILWDLLRSLFVYERSIRSGNGKERLQDIFGEEPIDIICGVVRHEVDDEVVSDWRHEPCKWLNDLLD